MELVCPNCGEQKSVGLPSESSIAIAICLHCGEIIVVYKKCAVALDRNILANGTIDEKRRHVAAMLLEFVRQDQDSDLAGVLECDDDLICPELAERLQTKSDLPPIDEREAQDFCRIDLNLIDRKVYFDRIFGDSAG